MDRTYRHLLLLQSLLAVANSMAAAFGIIFLLDPAVTRPPFVAADVALMNLVSFAVSAVGCVAFTRVRPVRSRVSMAVGLAVLASSYLAYLGLRGTPLLLYVGFAWGVYIPMFFLPFNALVIGVTKAEDRAAKIGSFVLAYTIVAIAMPTVGGLLIDTVGYGALFGLASVVLLADIALLFRLGQGLDRVSFAFDFRGLGARTCAAFLAEGGFEGMVFAIIPVIAYQFATEPIDLGGLFSLFALAGGVVTVALGVLSDRLRNRRPFVLAGAAFSVVASLLVVRASSLGEFALGNSLLALTSSVVPLFLFTICVERLLGRPAMAIATREVLLNAGRTLSLGAFFLLVLVGLTAQQAFLLAAASLTIVALSDPAIRPSPSTGSRAHGANQRGDRRGEGEEKESQPRV